MLQVYGQDVPTAGAGRVVFAGDRGTYGTMIVLEHPSGQQTLYAHLSAARVKAGDQVGAGQVIGETGRQRPGHGSAPTFRGDRRRTHDRSRPPLGRQPPRRPVTKDTAAVADSRSGSLLSDLMRRVAAGATTVIIDGNRVDLLNPGSTASVGRQSRPETGPPRTRRRRPPTR